MLRVFRSCELIVVSSEPPFSSSSGQNDVCCGNARVVIIHDRRPRGRRSLCYSRIIISRIIDHLIRSRRMRIHEGGLHARMMEAVGVTSRIA